MVKAKKKKKPSTRNTKIGWITIKIEDPPEVKKLKRTVKFKHIKSQLLEFTISGMEYSVKNINEGKKLFAELVEGELVTVVHERNNEHDEFACAIYYKGTKLGYIPRTHNQSIIKLGQKNKRFSFVIKKSVDFESFYTDYVRPQILAICY